MYLRAFFIALISLSIISCSTGKLTVSSLTATWELGNVYENQVNVTNRENPNRDRFITFYPNGTFVSGGAPYGDLSGKWIITEEKTLRIIPDKEGEVGSSEWNVSFDKEIMNWTGTIKSGLDRFELSWRKK